MNEEHIQILVDTAPLLYRSYGKVNTGHPFSRWGFMCGDGWFDLLMRLSARMEAELHASMASGKRRQDLPQASEIKEKFGLLRFYVHRQPIHWGDWIDEAKRESKKTCELCGRPGGLHIGIGIKTLCEVCAKQDGWKLAEARQPDKVIPSLSMETHAELVSARPLLLFNPRSRDVQISVPPECLPAVERMVDRMEAALNQLVEAGQSVDELPVVRRIWLDHGYLNVEIEPDSFLDLPEAVQNEFDAALTEASGL